MSRAVIHFRSVLSVALVLAACTDSFGPGSELITELPRALTVAEQRVIGGVNSFGLDLIREVVARDGRANIVLSPLSASMALGMTLNGADGETFSRMRATLGFADLSQEEINDSYHGLIELLTELDPEVRFDIANSLWANEDVPFHAAFLEAVKQAFEARSESRDFRDPATLAEINAWVEQSTNGLIDRILDELDPELALLLINAISFDGAWTTRFDPGETSRQGFTRADGSTVQVDMMSITDVEFPLGFGSDYTAVELPYGGAAFAMVVIVPHEDARDFLAGLDADTWDRVIGGLTPTTVDLVRIPKFKLTYDAFLNDALDAMGMGSAFRPGADFTRMSPIGNQICIDFVRQKTFIEVDERGTRAAAVTAVGARTFSFNGLIADRPFVFAIRERLTGTLLFVGLVGDPQAEDPGPEPLVSKCR